MSRFAAALLAVLVTLATALAWTVASAQEDDSEEKGRFTRFVEDTISTPDRRISLGSIDGVLSSDVRIDTITISDREGVWLTIENAHLVWSRLALLRGRLDIEALEADRIVVTRPPLAAESVDPAARPGFSLPALPVEVAIDRLAVPVIALAEPVVGEDVTLSADGAVSLQGGTLDARFAIRRTDEKPGEFTLAATFADATRQLDLDLRLSEPENGVVANLLGIPDRPAVAFGIVGSGPLSAFAADITLDAAGRRLVAGRATISEAAEAFRFVADIDGDLSPLVPPAWADYVRGTSTLAVDATRQPDGSIALARAEIVSGVASLVVGGDFAPDGFPTRLTVDGRLADPAGPVTLPGAGTVEEARFQVAFGGDADRWRATFDLAGLDTGSLEAGRSRIVAEGVAENLADPATRRLTFTVDGALEALAARDPDLARALGDAFTVTARGAWTAGSPVDVEIAEIKNANAAAHFAGTIDGATLDGRFWLNAADIAPFAGLAGRDISGATTLEANGTVAAATGAFALTLDAETVDLSIGDPSVDALLAGRTTLAGGASRSTEGLRFTDLRIENPRLSARLDGAYDLAAADLAISAEIADVAAVTDRASGPVSLSASIVGQGTSPTVTASVSADGLKLQGRTLNQGLIRFVGTVSGAALDGDVTLSGSLDDVPIDGAAAVSTNLDGSRRIEGLRVSAGANTLAGALLMGPDGLLTGDLSLDAPDLALIGPLLLTDAAGGLTADVRLTPDQGRQGATIRASASDLRVEGNRIGSADVNLSVGDLFGVPNVDGRFESARLAVGGLVIDAASGTATVRPDGGTDFDIAADLAQGRLAAAGALARVEGGFDLTLARLDLTRDPDLRASLAAPVTVSIRGETITIPDAAITVGGGRIAVRGTVAETLDLTATVDRLPLSLANAVMPDLALAGTVSGSLRAEGPRADPSATFDLRGEGISAAPLRQAGVGPLAVTASGTYAAGTARFSAETTVSGGRVRIEGTAGTDLDLAVTVNGLPLSLADAASPGLGAQGTLDASAIVRGTPAAPLVDFTATSRGVSVGALRAAGVGPLAVEAAGRFEDNRIALRSARASGGGIALTASGTIPVDGGPLDLGVSGEVPLSLADRSLATRGARLSGTAAVDVRVAGTAAAPEVTGAITVEGASFVDPETTTRLTGVSLRVALAGRTATVERFTAATNGGGRLSASGTIGLDPAAGFPLNLALDFNDARLTDGKIVTAVASGRLTAVGPATGNLAVSGTVNIARAEITVPETLPGRATLLDVRHRLPPLNVRRTLERARLSTQARDSGAGAAGLTLNVTINAPERVFVRGRGIDAELGGSVTVTGPISAIQPVGSLELIRGRLDVIGQRITFTSGRVTLVGDLDPYIDLVATARSARITVTATVSGQASDPKITLSSTPELPQDEVLAHFLFGRSLDELSPLQIANLALAAAQLAGGGGGVDLLGQLRKATGLDDLDVVTDSEGNAAVQAGRYISENVYLGVTAGANGQANVSVNLDLTDNLKARVEVGPQSGGKVGVFYEKEY